MFYAYESLICWEAELKEFRLLYDGRFAKSGALATVDRFREQFAADDGAPLNADEVESRLAEYLGNLPLGCASPAIADGRIYPRLQECVACYDVRQSTAGPTPVNEGHDDDHPGPNAAGVFSWTEGRSPRPGRLAKSANVGATPMVHRIPHRLIRRRRIDPWGAAGVVRFEFP